VQKQGQVGRWAGGQIVVEDLGHQLPTASDGPQAGRRRAPRGLDSIPDPGTSRASRGARLRKNTKI